MSSAPAARKLSPSTATTTRNTPPAERTAKPATSRPGWGETFASLRVRNYRLYVSSQVLTNTCGWMQRIAQDWLILSLTGNVALVGLTVTLQLGPMLLFGLWGGVLADRFDKRRILMVTQSLFGLSALTVGLLTLTGAIQPWHILASAAFLGLATVVDNPTRQAFVSEVAGYQHLRNAISLNSTVFQMGALVGPALAGAGIAAVGEGWAFVVNSVACMAAVALLIAMRPAELNPAPVVARASGQLREGLRYVGGKPEILWAVVLVGFVAITGINMATVLAAYADNVFDAGSGGFGLLSSCLAAGAVTGALANTRRRSLRLRHLVYGAAALGMLQMLASTLQSQLLFSAALVGVGAASLLYLTGGNTLVQSSVAATMRGRVMALYIMVFFGAQAASGSIIGWVAEHFGAQLAMVACGAGPLTGALVVGTILSRKAGLVPRIILRDRPGRGFVYVVPRSTLSSQATARTEEPPSADSDSATDTTIDPATVTAVASTEGTATPTETGPQPAPTASSHHTSGIDEGFGSPARIRRGSRIQNHARRVDDRRPGSRRHGSRTRWPQRRERL